MACTPQDLVTAASKFQGIPTGMQTNIATAVACQLAGIPADPQALVEASKCIECGKTEPILLAIAAVCNLSSGGATFTITAPSDTDAFNYWVEWIVGCFTGNGCTVFSSAWSPGGHIVLPVACATVCGATQTGADAVDALVISLKAAGLWTLMDVIYPFMGGTSASCALNLKDPNSFAITWHGGVNFSASGVTGNGTTGYGDTGFTPTVSGSNFTLNSAALGFYRTTAVNTAALGGNVNLLGQGSFINHSLVVGWQGAINTNNGPGIVQGSPVNGNYIISRTASNLQTLYVPWTTPATDATAPALSSTFSLFVLAQNFSAVAINFSSDTISFMWVGAGLDGTQTASLETIITTFETALGRA